MFSFRDTTYHPSETELLFYVDGELSFKEAMKIRSHLEHCWRCRTRAGAQQGTIEDFVKFLDNDYTPHLPQPRNGGREFAARLQALVTAQPRKQRRFAVLSRGAHFWRPLALGSVPVIVALLVLIALRQPPAVSAAELLTRAINSQAASALSVLSGHRQRQDLRVNVGGKTFRHEIIHGANAQLGSDAPSSPEETRLELILKKNHLDWRNPLSAASFAAWRDSLPQKKDQVTKVGDQWTLATTSRRPTDGVDEIIEATLTLRASDFHPVRATFLTQESPVPTLVEITELGTEILPEVNPVAPAHSRTRLARATILKPELPVLAPATSIETASTELEADVLARLHSVGADLGQEAIVVRTPENQLAVTSIVDSSERKQELLSALAPLQSRPALRVQVRTTEEALDQPSLDNGDQAPAESIILTESDTTANKIAATPTLLAYFAQIGIPVAERNAEVQHFARQAVTESSTALLHALALRDLFVRFPEMQAGSVGIQNESVQSELGQILSDHLRAIREATVKLQDELSPVFAPAESLGESDLAAPAGSGLQRNADTTSEIQGLVKLTEKNDEAVHAALTLSTNGTSQADEIGSVAFWHSLADVLRLARTIESQNQPSERGTKR